MRQSQLFTKTRKEAPADEVSKNAQLLIRAGYVHKEMENRCLLSLKQQIRSGLLKARFLLNFSYVRFINLFVRIITHI